MPSEPLILVRNRGIQVVVIREAEEHDVGAGSERANSGSHVLGFGETGEAPVCTENLDPDVMVMKGPSL
jgi:hypothetical protein